MTIVEPTSSTSLPTSKSPISPSPTRLEAQESFTTAADVMIVDEETANVDNVIKCETSKVIHATANSASDQTVGFIFNCSTFS